MIGYSFDLSKRNTGVAKWDFGNLASVHEISFQEYQYFGEVLLAFNRFVKRATFAQPLDWVAYEEVMVRNKLHGELHFGMVAILAMRAAHLQVPLMGVNTMTMKKFVAGKGNCTKGEMVASVRSHYPEHDIPGHDAADAVAVGMYAQSLFT